MKKTIKKVGRPRKETTPTPVKKSVPSNKFRYAVSSGDGVLFLHDSVEEAYLEHIKSNGIMPLTAFKVEIMGDVNHTIIIK
jgi:hypothetical protein